MQYRPTVIVHHYNLATTRCRRPKNKPRPMFRLVCRLLAH